MNKLLLKIHTFLEQAAAGKVEADEKLLDEFAERVKQKLKAKLEEPRKEFKLSMSNVGRPLRQLMLEQKYGKQKPDASFMLKMLFGDMYEAITVFLLKSSGVEIDEQDTQVVLPIKTKKGIVNLTGTLDIGIKNEGIYDIKSASPYSFNNKFDADSILLDGDPFGYVDQIFGYAAGRGKKAKGWIIVNKVDGKMKVCELPDNIQQEAMEKTLGKIKAKVCHIVEGKPMPECEGVVEEAYFGKKTGNKILGPSCKFCPHKDKCHPGIEYRQSVVSKAKEPKFEWYIPPVKEIKK